MKENCAKIGVSRQNRKAGGIPLAMNRIAQQMRFMQAEKIIFETLLQAFFDVRIIREALNNSASAGPKSSAVSSRRMIQSFLRKDWEQGWHMLGLRCSFKGESWVYPIARKHRIRGSDLKTIFPLHSSHGSSILYPETERRGSCL